MAEMIASVGGSLGAWEWEPGSGSLGGVHV